jgi:hypothetical protein
MPWKTVGQSREDLCSLKSLLHGTADLPAPQERRQAAFSRA